jgi:hypothetical protein
MSLDKSTLDLSVGILSSVANEDSIRIFIECVEGITSSTRTIVDLSLTQKRYYTWLKRLIDAGLVEKHRNAYVQTMLGKLCYRLGMALSDAVQRREKLELADKLMKANTFSMKDKEEILTKISKIDLMDGASLRDIIHEVRMIEDYDDLISETIKLMDKAKKSAYIAAHRTDMKVLDAMVGAIDRGVKFQFLGCEKEQPYEDKQALRMILSPALIKTMQKVISSGEISTRLTKVPFYSFCVIDGVYGIVELSHPVYHGFCVAFEFKNEMFCETLIDTFNHLYDEGNKYPLVKFVEKYSTLYK